MNRIPLFFACLVLLGLQGCAGMAQSQKGVAVTPGQSFSGEYINITAPNSDGWELIQSSGLGMVFAKRGQAANESIVAQVSMFNLAPTDTPQEFEVLIKMLAAKGTDPSRFDVQKINFEYSSERSYPCVRLRSVALDKAPQGLNGALLLEIDGLYCRHPLRQETGFAIIYSHRGESLYANCRVEAESFIQSVQVPGK